LQETTKFHPAVAHTCPKFVFCTRLLHSPVRPVANPNS